MPDPQENSAAVEPRGLGDYRRYVTESRLEINQILHALMRESSLLTASPGGDDFFLTSIVGVDEKSDQLLLECGKSTAVTQRVLETQRMICNTSLDKVKIQFTCHAIEVLTEGGETNFRTSLPSELMRLQRRENYRISIPMATPVTCSISVLSSEPPAVVELTMLDISCGGLSVMTPPSLFAPEIGAYYEGAIDLPGTGELRVHIQARNAFVMTLANGKTTQRSGFAFVDLPGNMLAKIQRYIMTLQRERKVRTNSR